jgi:hypothetical protein
MIFYGVGFLWELADKLAAVRLCKRYAIECAAVLSCWCSGDCCDERAHYKTAKNPDAGFFCPVCGTKEKRAESGHVRLRVIPRNIMGNVNKKGRLPVCGMMNDLLHSVDQGPDMGIKGGHDA